VPTEIIEQQVVEIKPDLSYVEQPIQILDTKERVTRRKRLRMYKILWDHHTIDEATWETEDYLQRNFPEFLVITFHIYHSCNLGMRFLLGGKVVTP
jgi:hypothetical protein